MVEWREKLAGSFWGVALEQGCDLGAGSGDKMKELKLFWYEDVYE